MKSVLISIRPKWCELIASGRKTIEVRKTRPKLETPFKCYIYCVKPSKQHQAICGCMVLNDDELYRHPRQGIKYGDSIELMCEDGITKDNFLNGKAIGEFMCDRIDHYLRIGLEPHYHYRTTTFGDVDYSAIGLTEREMLDYGGGNVYGWHISNLTIYDRPRELSEFRTISKECLRHGQDGVPVCERSIKCTMCSLTRPPQSWCYVEEVTDQ